MANIFNTQMYNDFFANIERNATIKMEELATGVLGIEKEFVFYARLKNLSFLKDAISVETHEQWEIKLLKTNNSKAKARLRIRKTTYPTNTQKPAEYTFTIKTKRPDGFEDEVTTISSEDAFNAFKHISESGMLKTRYCMQIPGRQALWEIDTFDTKDGQKQDWCKIDYEVTQNEPEELPNLPMGFTDIIPALDRTPEQLAQIDVLYERIFRRENNT